MKVLRAKRVIYRIEKNEDGTLSVFREYFSTKNMDSWKRDGRPYKDAGLLITQHGGIEALLSKCEEIEDVEGFVCNLNKEKKAIREAAKDMRSNQAIIEAAKAKEAYDAAFSQEVTESTADNIYILLRYLNTINWGVWNLPRMTISYTCNQYDCDGRTATTIKLDAPIIHNGNQETMFVYGNPRGHLEKYLKIG